MVQVQGCTDGASKLGGDDIPPATVQEELAWITQYDEVAGKYADWICACRHKAVFGEWPDNRKPNLPSTRGLDQSNANWLMAQMHPNKWEKARRQAAEKGWSAVLKKPYPIWQDRTAKHPPSIEGGQPAVQPEAFPGQREWLKKQAQRELRLDAAIREPQIRLQLYDLRTEQTSIKGWFEPHLGVADDVEWKAQYMRLQELAGLIQQLEADLKLVEGLIAGHVQQAPRPRRIVARYLHATDRRQRRRSWRIHQKFAADPIPEAEPLPPIITEAILPGDDSLIAMLQSEIPDARQLWEQSVLDARRDRLHKRHQQADERALAARMLTTD